MTQTSHMNQPNDPLTSVQIRMVSFLWVSYAAFYLGRLNISPALPEIADSLQIGLGEVGILGNVFFWCYAIGQIISGQLGSIFSPHRVVLVGLVLVALANIGFAFQTTLLMMAVLWGINGFAQSMGWGPILRILSSKTTDEQKHRLALVFSMTFQIGTSLAWGLSAVLIVVSGYRLSFLVAGFILLVMAIFWYVRGLDAEVDETQPSTTKISFADIANDIRQIFPMLLVSMLIGFIYVSFLLWLPTLIQNWEFLPNVFGGLLTVIVPLIGIPGMMLSGRLLAWQSNLFTTIAQLLLAMLICLGLSAMSTGIYQIVPILLTVMFVSGLAGLLLSAAPMLLVASHRVASAGGLLTAVWGLSGGFAGSVVGSLVDTSGWEAVYGLWMINTVLALGIIAGVAWQMRGRTKLEGEGK